MCERLATCELAVVSYAMLELVMKSRAYMLAGEYETAMVLHKQAIGELKGFIGVSVLQAQRLHCK